MGENSEGPSGKWGCAHQDRGWGKTKAVPPGAWDVVGVGCCRETLGPGWKGDWCGQYWTPG